MSGTLYLCATPIGNLGDISARCLEIFENVDIIACEDTRRTLQLLNHFGIKKQLTSYHEHNKAEKGEIIVNMLKSGKNVALVSDAGTPAISDPGEDLVKLCIKNELNVTSVPGPVAAVNALILSGLSTSRFSFEGFLSVNKRHRFEHLESVKNDTHTLIFYEAPHKLKRTLADMLEILGNRRLALVRELTKIHEEVIHTDLESAQSLYSENSPKGEFVLVIEGAAEVETENFWDTLSVSEHIDFYINDGLKKTEAIKKVAKERGLLRHDVYNEYHKIDKGDK
ncbi:MAG TPA: 16S rRNA (cytidine(1402)-2'-O)-methyltransferase [Clostridiales bacterium]|nr:16S rRNA (cytidine(1402)-2'-O)-methyltransferase [Clostridiales bacterium]